MLPSGVVQTLAMALHELTTNAVKYGAFSQQTGRIDIRWRIEVPGGSVALDRMSTGRKAASRPDR